MAGGKPIIIMMIKGLGEIAASGPPIIFARGDTVLLPAALNDITVRSQGDSLWLQVNLGRNPT
jgi:mannose-6-phosphate isomerase class I